MRQILNDSVAVMLVFYVIIQVVALVAALYCCHVYKCCQCLSTRHLPEVISLFVLQDYKYLYTAVMLNRVDIVEHFLDIGLDATETREVSYASVFACCIKMLHSWQTMSCQRSSRGNVPAANVRV